MRLMNKGNGIATMFFIAGVLVIYVLKTFAAKGHKNSLTTVVIHDQFIDLGEITSPDQAFANFQLLNAGKVDLEITKVVPDCSCSVPFWPDKPVKPTENANISVQYNDFSPGFFQQKILVHCNAENSPLLLTIEGHVML